MTSPEKPDASDVPDALRDLLQQTAATHFDAGFDDRVLARLATTPSLRLVSSDDSLVLTGRRWLPWLAAAAVLLAFIDRRESRARDSVATTASSDIGAMTVPDWSAYQ